MKKNPVNSVINIAYYKESDWERFIESIEDPDFMHKTWKDWHNAFLKTKNGLINLGFNVKEFVVDIDELSNFCKMNGIKNDGNARSRFVTPK